MTVVAAGEPFGTASLSDPAPTVLAMFVVASLLARRRRRFICTDPVLAIDATICDIVIWQRGLGREGKLRRPYDVAALLTSA